MYKVVGIESSTTVDLASKLEKLLNEFKDTHVLFSTINFVPSASRNKVVPTVEKHMVVNNAYDSIGGTTSLFETSNNYNGILIILIESGNPTL